MSNITKNKARRVAQGYTQVEGINYDETFVHVACLDAIRLLLALAYHLKFKVLSDGCVDCIPEWISK